METTQNEREKNPIIKLAVLLGRWHAKYGTPWLNAANPHTRFFELGEVHLRVEVVKLVIGGVRIQINVTTTLSMSLEEIVVVLQNNEGVSFWEHLHQVDYKTFTHSFEALPAESYKFWLTDVAPRS